MLQLFKRFEGGAGEADQLTEGLRVEDSGTARTVITGLLAQI